MSVLFSPHEYATIERVIQILQRSKVNYKTPIYEERQIGGGFKSLDEPQYQSIKVGERDAQRQPTVDEFVKYFEERLKKSKELDGGVI